MDFANTAAGPQSPLRTLGLSIALIYSESRANIVHFSMTENNIASIELQ